MRANFKSVKDDGSFKDDDRGIYSIFLLLVISVLLVAIGFAIDAPRQHTANQRVRNVAEEAARYAVVQIVESTGTETLNQRFQDAEESTRDFIALETRSSFPLVLREFSCNPDTGSVVVEVRGTLRNGLSGAFLGPFRRFTGEGSASLNFVDTGGSSGGINICTGELSGN